MNRIKEILKDKGISQTWLAEKMDKSYPTINEYARNKRQPSLEDLYKIAGILQVNAKDLLVDSAPSTTLEVKINKGK
ncbi:transcriptional regulator [Putridiphycobacter roseus]|uniref:Transcriptional regulator n=1 Tax=Putridiphycobacter roseus TaxID=2219161 RepID=A0A2W1NJ19_9FLAO|nr:helix-turn-helix transcriptional regulator [Putridiphycobacter roseus]PZE15622.1 transcriptional regulator [Putridiphycobacter roseus]